MKREIFGILLLLIGLMAKAQVTGRVIDSKTREALDYVNVYYDGKNVGEQTDEDGRFVIKEDSTWKELTISTMGYQTQTIKLKDFGKNKDITVKLVPDSKTLSAVTVQPQEQPRRGTDEEGHRQQKAERPPLEGLLHLHEI